MRQVNLFSRPKAFLIIASLGCGVYGNQQVKKAHQDPEYFYKNLHIDLKSEQPLDVEVTTPTGLKLRPTRKTDFDAYRRIFGDAKTMVTYVNGAEAEQSTTKRLDMYEVRVLNGYVWTGLAIEKYGPMITCLIGLVGPDRFHQVEKSLSIKPSTEIIGHIAVGNGDEPGEVQMGMVIGANIHGKNYQGQGHGTAASRAAAALTLFHIHHNKLVTINNVPAPVTTVAATALHDNIPSQRILHNVWNMRVNPNKVIADKQRQYWSTSVTDLEKHTFSSPVSR